MLLKMHGIFSSIGLAVPGAIPIAASPPPKIQHGGHPKIFFQDGVEKDDVIKKILKNAINATFLMTSSKIQDGVHPPTLRSLEKNLMTKKSKKRPPSNFREGLKKSKMASALQF